MISGLGVHKDYYLFTRLLTTVEKESYTNTPELFYAMAQADSTCVLNMPMCETDGFARNMKSYTTESKISEDFSTSATNFNNFTTSSFSIANGLMSVITSVVTNGVYESFDTIIGATYLVRVKTVSNTGDYMTRVGNGIIPDAGIYTTDTKTIPSEYSFTFIAQSTTSYVYLRNLNPSTTVYDYVYVDRVTGVYPITNYTSSVRDNAKNLQYGLQTCKFVRDSLGVIQSASDYLECSGTGYATIPSHTDTVNIKMTVNPTSLSGNLLSGGVTKTLTGLTLNADNDVVVSNVTPTGAITLASGFSGTIKSYKEELS